jgi:hypothetical protein
MYFIILACILLISNQVFGAKPSPAPAVRQPPPSLQVQSKIKILFPKGKFGIGVSTQLLRFWLDENLSPGAPRFPLPWGDLSFKYFFTDRVAAQILLGVAHDSVKDTQDNEVSLTFFRMMPKFSYSLYLGENSHLYLGGGIGFLIGGRETRAAGGEPAETGMFAFHFLIDIGAEYFPELIPNLALSASTGLNILYGSEDPEGEGANTKFSFYIAQGGPRARLIPWLDYLTLAIHYYF